VVGALVTSVVVAAMPLLGDVHVDGDTHGGGVLAWDGLQGSTFVAQATEVEAGRRVGRIHDLWRTHASVAVEDVDVASSGAAVVCFRERPRRSGASRNAWRVRVVMRSESGRWSRPVLVAAPRRWVEDIDCGVDDTGNAVLAWREDIAARVRASTVSAGGAVGRPVTLGRHPEPPDVEMSPDGAAVVSFASHEQETRHLYIAEWLPDTGWSSVVEVPPGDESVQGPELAVDGTGRRLLGWNGGGSDAVRLATGTGTALAPSTLVRGDNIALGSLTAGTRGDVLATYYTHASTGKRSTLHAIVQRPGAPFGTPVSLGRFVAYPLQAAVAADGSGLVAWVGGSDRRPHTVARSLAADGSWGPTRLLSHTGEATGLDIGIAAGPPGRSTIAWSVGRFGSGRERLRIAAM
jgi:hypothetical protein